MYWSHDPKGAGQIPAASELVTKDGTAGAVFLIVMRKDTYKLVDTAGQITAVVLNGPKTGNLPLIAKQIMK